MTTPTYWQDLRVVLGMMRPGPGDRAMWVDVWDELGWVGSALADLLLSLLIVTMRLLAQLTFPVSIWGTVWLVRRKRAKAIRRIAAIDAACDAERDRLTQVQPRKPTTETSPEARP